MGGNADGTGTSDQGGCVTCALLRGPAPLPVPGSSRASIPAGGPGSSLASIPARATAVGAGDLPTPRTPADEAPMAAGPSGAPNAALPPAAALSPTPPTGMPPPPARPSADVPRAGPPTGMPPPPARPSADVPRAGPPTGMLPPPPRDPKAVVTRAHRKSHLWGRVVGLVEGADCKVWGGVAQRLEVGERLQRALGVATGGGLKSGWRVEVSVW
eukprot:scaffold32028_cov91-Isochrysis_galbana.AAC.1